MDFSFRLPFSFILFAFIFVQSATNNKVKCPSKLMKINFNLQFKCGPYRGAEGRLFMRLKKAKVAGWESGSGYTDVFETVLNQTHNGIFNQSIVVKLFPLRTDLFEMFFRTNCYILNRFGECCAHDFKFHIPVLKGGSKGIYEHHWFKSTFDREETGHRRCKGYGKDCTFTFDTHDELNMHGQTNVIDLRELSVNAQNYLEKRSAWNLEGPSKMAYTSKRLCSPIDDFSQKSFWEKAKDKIESGVDDYAFYENWKICDHPRYGPDISSFDLPAEKKKYEECLGEDGIPKKCECNK